MLVEVMMRVVSIEGCPAAIAALQPDDPFAGAVDRLVEVYADCGGIRRRARSMAMTTTAVSSRSG
jgi:hypothetical protein